MAQPVTGIEERLLNQAHALGATLAGIARTEAVTGSPSHQGRIAGFAGVGSAEWEATSDWAEESHAPAAGSPGEAPETDDTAGWKFGHPGGLLFAEGAVVVVALAHSPEEPALDWWGVPGGTRGNGLLMEITEGLSSWLTAELGTEAHDLPYYPDKGGAFLKDAAVLAGLGCIGKNNLLVTPEHGPRVRLRGVAVDAPLSPSGPLWPDPCDGCSEPCRSACPQDAFARVVHSSIALETLTLPGRTGCFNRETCNLQMLADEAAATDGLVRYCRRCELSCIAGL
ncbi:MAG: 4Fe-4S binding protein [Thermoleophilia bacterium]